MDRQDASPTKAAQSLWHTRQQHTPWVAPAEHLHVAILWFPWRQDTSYWQRPAKLAAISAAIRNEIRPEDNDIEKREMILRQIVLSDKSPFIGKTLKEEWHYATNTTVWL